MDVGACTRALTLGHPDFIFVMKTHAVDGKMCLADAPFCSGRTFSKGPCGISLTIANSGAFAGPK